MESMEYMECELSGISQVKVVVKHMVLGSPFNVYES